MIAIVLGIIAGIGIAGFVIFNSKQASQNDSDVILDDISPTIAINTDEIAPLLITKPENETVTDATSISIEGSSQEGSLIVIQTPSGEQAFENTKKNFTADVELSQGENTIRITAYDAKNIDSRTLTIYSIPTE